MEKRKHDASSDINGEINDYVHSFSQRFQQKERWRLDDENVRSLARLEEFV